MRGRLITGILLLGALSLLTACAVPDWVFDSRDGITIEPQDAYPAIGTVAVTGTPIDAVGSEPVPTITLPPAANSAAVQTAEPAPPTPPTNGEVCSGKDTGKSLSYEQAMAIAADGACLAAGELLPDHFCNPNTGTWWIGLVVDREGCSPACVVDVDSGTAEINWRCTGALLPTAETPQPQQTPVPQQTPEPQQTADSLPADDGVDGFRDWRGLIYRQPSGSLVEYRFLRDDGQWFDISAQESKIREKFAAAAWSAVKVELSGRETAVPGSLTVQRLVELPLKSGQARNLTPFAMPETSSRLATDEGGAYFSWSAVDGSLSDPWCEGAEGPGSGEWLQLDFSAPLQITEIRLANGYQSGDYLYMLNNRVKTVSIYVDGEWLDEWILPDSATWQTFTLAGDVAPGVTASSIRLVIEDEIEGWAFDDTCIAEVEVWGKPR